MTRYLCCLVVLGVLALPDWASAFNQGWGPPWRTRVGARLFGPTQVAYYPPCPAPVYAPPPCVPVYQLPPPSPCVYPPVVFAPPIAYPVTVAPSKAPAVAVVPKSAPPASRPTEPPSVTIEPPPPETSPKWEGVRPAAATTPNPKPMAPKPTPPDPKPLATPTPAPATPSVGIDPPDEDKLPPLTLPGAGTPDVPAAVPAPAPPPEPGPGLAPPLPTLPGLGDPVTPVGRSDDDLPPLVLPPEGLGGSSGVIPPARTSRASPLAGGVRVKVFTTAGNAPAGALRKVGFFNHTNRNIELVVAGQKATLPGRTYIHATVPVAFEWGHAGNPPRREEIPADAPGLDVVFRD